MATKIQALLILQDRDQRLNKMEHDLDHLPQEKAALEAHRQKLQTALETHRESSRKIEADRKKLELEVQSKATLIKRYQSQMLETRKNEEYAALDQEILREKKAIDALEEQELILMEAYDESKKAIQEEEKSLQEYQAQATLAAQKLEQKQSHLEQAYQEAEQELAQAEAGVDEPSLRLYQRLILSKGDVAIVAIDHHTCSGCHMQLPPQTLISAKAQERITQCDHCGRIVYLPD